MLGNIDRRHGCCDAIVFIGTGGAGHDADDGRNDESEQDINEGFVGTMHRFGSSQGNRTGRATGWGRPRGASETQV